MIDAVEIDALRAQAAELRPELHRYCARLTGSIYDGEDLVQDVLARAFAALDRAENAPPLRPWLFRIAHNRAVDLARQRVLRKSEPLDDDHAVMTDAAAADDALMQREAVTAALSRFIELPVAQRSAVILKDVLDHSLREIADMLDLSIDAVKALLARGRVRLQHAAHQADAQSGGRQISEETRRYAALFNAHDWDGLRAMLAQDVRLLQATHPPRTGATDVGMFFTIYAQMPDITVQPAWIDGREVLAVFEGDARKTPAYAMQIEWRDGGIIAINDFRYVRYMFNEAGIED